MGVKITSRIYKELFTTGDTNWLLGNVGEWQKLTLNAEASVDYFATMSEPIIVNQVDKSLTLQNGKKWSDYGFDIGQSCTFRFRYTNTIGLDFYLQGTFTIMNLYGDKLEADTLIAGGIPLSNGSFPVERADDKTSEVTVTANEEPEGVTLTYGHIANADSESDELKSVIDSSTTSFVYPNIKAEALNTVHAMQAVGIQSGMSVRTATVKRQGLKPGSTNVYLYEIVIEYLISSFFDSITDIESLTPPEYLQNAASLTDNFKIKFTPKWNNPNTLIQNDLADTARLGNTGWFNENFNELINEFLVESLSYLDVNGNAVDALDFVAETKVVGIVSGVPNVSALTECGFGFMWIPKTDADYKNRLTPFYQNTFVQTGRLTDGYNVGTFYPATNIGAGVGGGIDTKNVKFTDLGGGRISFEANFMPTANFTNFFDARLEDDRKYIIWISVADRTLARNFSDRVSLLADFRDMIKTVPQAGAYPLITAEFLEHPVEELQPGVANYAGFSQDDVLCRLPFKVNYLTSDLQRIRFGVEVYNPSTNVRRILDKFDCNMTQFPDDANGVPQFSINTIRGFKLENGNNKNWVKINREPAMDAPGQSGYLAYFAFKIRYEDWIALGGMPNDFFDALALNHGFNNEWFHYLNTLGWQVAFFTEIQTIENGGLLEYRNRWDMTFKHYDTNTLIQTTHNYYRDADGTLLNVGTDPDSGRPLGVVLSNEPTRLEISYTIQDSGAWDGANLYAVTTIEIDRGAGFKEMRQLSSVWGFENDNPLRPLPGEDGLKIQVSGDFKTVKTSCLIDPQLLDDAPRYRITGRVGCFDGGQPPITLGKYEARYEDRYE